MSTSLLARPQPLAQSFHLAAGWGPVMEVRPASALSSLVTVSLADEMRALVELDFDSATGAIAGCRLQKYHDVGQQTPPADTPEVAGAPGLLVPTISRHLAIPRLVCSKHLTAPDRGDLFLNWSGALRFDETSVCELKSQNGFVQGYLRAYFLQDAWVALRLEQVPVTIFNEMPPFTAPGR